MKRDACLLLALVLQVAAMLGLYAADLLTDQCREAAAGLRIIPARPAFSSALEWTLALGSIALFALSWILLGHAWWRSRL